MTGSPIPEHPAPDHQTLENDRCDHLHILDEVQENGAAWYGMANGSMAKRDGGAGDGAAGGRTNEKDEEEKEEEDSMRTSNTQLNPFKAIDSKSKVHVSLIDCLYCYDPSYLQ